MRFYEKLEKTSENRIAPRSYYIPGGKSEYMLLNGDWRFKYFDCDAYFTEEISDWDTIPVPSCWQLKGYDNPNYTNINYPYPCDPPYVPDINPCGVYERELELKSLWGRVYFVFEGVSSCAELYVNGRYVGFTQGSHLQAEFDITDYVNKGSNTVRAVVYKWCCGSYLEDQDFLRYNGIFRDCYILQRPENHLTDVVVEACGNEVAVNLTAKAEVELFDAEGNSVGSAEGEGRVLINVPDAIMWNAEKPYLYTAKITRDGEEIAIKTGFRTIAVSDEGALLINGVAVKLRGVNHHDTDKYNGWCQTNAELDRDLALMKSLNINCVRTSHYPPTPYFVERCNELGFYVVLENDIEAHGFLRRNANVDYKYDVETGEWPCTCPEWRKEYVERMQRSAVLNRNHPSVIMWSTGNESGYGENTAAAIEFFKGFNDGRLAHSCEASLAGITETVDVFSQMYWPIDSIKSYLANPENKQPFFLCEYAHAMGNGPGDICDYNELFDENPKCIGGCVWEWADHVVTDENGVERYGGDFEGEKTHDYNFCCDGMVRADRSLKAGSLEIKTAYQPMKTSLCKDVLKVVNRLDFTNLNEYEFTYSIELDGKEISANSLCLDVPAHKTAELKLEIPELSGVYGAYLNCVLKKGGEELARTQHELEFEKQQVAVSSDAAEVKEGKNEIVFSGEGFCYTFSKLYGNFTSLVIAGKEQLAAPIAFSAWRAPTDNDAAIKLRWGNYNIWQGENLNVLFTKVYECSLSGGEVTVIGSLAGVSRKPFFRYTLKIAVFADGRISYSLLGDVSERCIWLPRLGFDFELACPTNKPFSYFGMGPGENYCDMHHAARMGMFESSADDEYVVYTRPQEHGNHINAKQLHVSDMIFGGERFEFAVSKFSIDAVTKAEHTDELIADGNTHVRIDYKVSGVGSAACGPALPEKYQLNDKKIDFGFEIRIK